MLRFGRSELFVFLLLSWYKEVNSGFISSCVYKTNHTDIAKVLGEKQDLPEDCIYYYLVDREQKRTGDGYHLLLQPPPTEDRINVTVDDVLIRTVDLLQRTSSQFNLHGDISISWHDDRLSWDESEFSDIQIFNLHDAHHIWTPQFGDETACTMQSGCMSKINDVEISSSGTVSARVTFRYPTFCTINYYRYPEETNDCCLFLSNSEDNHDIKYNIHTRAKQSVEKQVAVSKVEQEPGVTVVTTVDSSVWTVEDRTIDVAKIAGVRSEFLRLCVHAVKRMSTLRMALRVPVTIATMLMLVAPLFGDLKTQSYVKLVTLCLQTMCFLFLCSIAPENGFGGIKPKIYTFYEFLFVLSLISVMVTLMALALSRVRRTVPPMHGLYLTAKLLNKFLCCIEPDDSIAYERQFDELPEARAANPHPERDYTMEWRHIYIAGNNLFSGISFTMFVLLTVFDIV